MTDIEADLARHLDGTFQRYHQEGHFVSIRTDKPVPNPPGRPPKREYLFLRSSDVQEGPPPPPWREVLRVTCNYFDVKALDVISHRRFKSLTYPRNVFCWLMKQHTKHSYPVIGRFIGDRDHSTIINSVRRINQTFSTHLPTINAIEYELGLPQSYLQKVAA